MGGIGADAKTSPILAIIRYYIMKRKALPSVSLHKSEVTYRDTGVSKNPGHASVCKPFTHSAHDSLKIFFYQ